MTAPAFGFKSAYCIPRALRTGLRPAAEQISSAVHTRGEKGLMLSKNVFALAILAVTSGWADVVISAPQTTAAAPWGVINTSTYGQTITAPLDSVLQSFTFDLGPRSSGNGRIDFQADVYAWDSTTDEATGPALYQSAVSKYAPGAGYVPVTFSPGINVVGGQQYVLFFSTAGLQGGRRNSTVAWAINSHDAYSGGAFFFQNSGDAVEFTTTPWSQPGANFDLAFSADFVPSAVPEPSAIVLLATVIAFLGTQVYRRKANRIEG